MSYLLRKNYFKDYFWQAAGDHQVFGGAAPTNLLNRYDNKSYWYDFINAAAFRWYIGELKSTTKFYATTNHEYGVAPLTYTNKMGLFIYTGPNYSSVANPVQIVESSAEIPPDTLRGGFLGQYGAVDAVQYTGNIYEYAMAWIHDTDEGAAPTPVLSPSGITIYANAGAGGDGDGLHIIFVPVNSKLNMKDALGAWGTTTGPAIVVAKGACNNAANAINMVAIQEFTTYNDGTALTINLSTEYFARIEYWPENKPMKRLDLDDTDTPNLDRRVRIYFDSDKKKLGDSSKFVGEVSTVDYTYTTAKSYVDLICIDAYYDYPPGEEIWSQYGNHGFIQFDEVVVSSEWLPWDLMEAHCMLSDKFTHATISYEKDENELTHTFSDSGKYMPSLLQTDQIEIWSRCETIPIMQEMFYVSDFNVAFADGWTQASPTGAWAQQANYTGFTDEFTEAYTDKNNDTNWTITVGSWDTTNTAGWLYGATAQAATINTTQGSVDNDFVFDTKTNLTIPSDAFTLYFGTPGINTTIRAQITATTIAIAEHAVGAYQTRFTHSATMTGEHTIKIVRAGAFLKLYVDGVYADHAELVATACSADIITLDKAAAVTAFVDYVRTSPPFPNGYAYMTNVGNSTANTGDIYRAVAGNSDTGEFEITVWEAFDEGAADGQFFIKLHYDNGVAGTNWLGLQFTYTHATTTKALTLYHDSGTSKAITVASNQNTANIGYTEHKYRIFWNCSAAGGNITQVAVYSMTDGQFLGTYTSITEAYAGNMRVEIESINSDNCEPPYFGMCQFAETPEPTIDLIDVPVFHGEVRRIIPVDSDGMYTVLAACMTYPLRMMKSFSTGPLDYYSETEVSDENLLKKWLTENGDTYWRWFHWWNFDVSKMPGTWFPHRNRGFSAYDIFKKLARYSGLQWQITPEMQFLYTDFYRNFWASDILELSTLIPEGLFLDASSLTYFNQSQTNYITNAVRIDDATEGKRVGDVSLHPADFQWGADATDQVFNTVAVGHQAPSMTQYDPTVITGNLGTDVGDSMKDIIEATINADDANTAAATTNLLTSWGNSIMASHSHKNQRLAITALASKQWFRPMDKLEVKIGMYDPNLADVFTVVYDTLYVVQEAHHVCHENRVTYLVGRVEIYDDGGDVTGIDGYGDTTDAEERYGRTKDNAWWALSATLQ
jgi:hypothetical protein